jgi:hypothetical protein
MSYRLRSQEGLTTIQPEPCQWVHHAEVTPGPGHPRSGQMGHDLFVAESLGGWDGDGVAGKDAKIGERKQGRWVFSKPPHSAALPPLRSVLSTAYHTTLVYLVHYWCTLTHGVRSQSRGYASRGKAWDLRPVLRGMLAKEAI